MPEVMIAVQARSTSSRLPGKSLELIDQKTMTEHVLTACQNTASHINRGTPRHTVSAFTVLLVPTGDKLVTEFSGRCPIVEGPEEDVLTRYMLAVDKFAPDFVTRITADCPLMSPPLITKHIMAASKDQLDYCSNVWHRTFIDGWDVEVMSLEMMQWLNDSAKSGYDREHVTTLIRTHEPRWARYGSVISQIDFSDIKLSVDTREELERVRKNKEQVLFKTREAERAGHQTYKF